MADSISQGTLASWEKRCDNVLLELGEFVHRDEPVANIETDKVTIPVNCPENGTLIHLFAKEGDTVDVGSDLFKIETDAVPPKAEITSDVPDQAKRKSPKESKDQTIRESNPSKSLAEDKKETKAPAQNETKAPIQSETKAPIQSETKAPIQSETKEPIQNETKEPIQNETKTSSQNDLDPARRQVLKEEIQTTGFEKREKMSRMRLRIAERMKDAQNTAASLTTFNEVDMSALIKMRADFKDDFAKMHGVKLGFMSAFVKAASKVLLELPIVNARFDSATNEIVYNSSVDISVAVATPKGLVTPVLRDCESRTFSDVEKMIADYGQKARDGKIALEDLTGGTFTISNGGVFGSLMGTPILNTPQVAILGMHAIKERAVVVEGRVEARPMMYLALTYDHRLIDGREAVTFLVRLKQLLENPTRFMLDL